MAVDAGALKHPLQHLWCPKWPVVHGKFMSSETQVHGSIASSVGVKTNSNLSVLQHSLFQKTVWSYFSSDIPSSSSHPAELF